MKELNMGALIELVKNSDNQIAKIKIAERLVFMGGYDEDSIKDWVFNNFNEQIIKMTDEEYDKCIKWADELYELHLELEEYNSYMEGK